MGYGIKMPSTVSGIITVSCTSGTNYIPAHENRIYVDIQNASATLPLYVNLTTNATTTAYVYNLHCCSTDFALDPIGTGGKVRIEDYVGDIYLSYNGSTGKAIVCEIIASTAKTY